MPRMHDDRGTKSAQAAGDSAEARCRLLHGACTYDAELLPLSDMDLFCQAIDNSEVTVMRLRRFPYFAALEDLPPLYADAAMTDDTASYSLPISH